MGWARLGLGFRRVLGLGFRAEVGFMVRVRAEVKAEVKARAGRGGGPVTLFKSTRELRVSICSANELIEVTWLGVGLG